MVLFCGAKSKFTLKTNHNKSKQLNQLLRPVSQFEIKFPFAIELFFASGTVPVDPAPFAAGEDPGPSSVGPSSTVVGLALKVLRTSLKS